MPQEASLSTEVKEIIPTSDYIGLHARLIHQDKSVLSPNKTNLSELKPEDLQNFENRDYAIFNNASVKERKENTQSYEDWKKDTLTLFQDSRDFFTNSEQGKKWTEFFKKALDINFAEIKETDIDNLTNKYLTGNNSNIKEFVKDIISKYKKEDGKIDLNQLEENGEALVWISGVFGSNSAEVINQLVQAEVELVNESQTLIEKANQKIDGQLRINQLNEEEKSMLKFLSSELPTESIVDNQNENLETEEKNEAGLSLQNLDASRKLIEKMRQEKSRKPDGTIITDLDLEIAPNGYFNPSQVVVAMEDKFNLPMAIYAPAGHAFLVTKGPYYDNELGSYAIRIWNPFGLRINGVSTSGTEKIAINYDPNKPEDLQNINIYANSLFFQQHSKNPQENDLESLLDQTGFKDIKESLKEMKFMPLQEDITSCVPLCVFDAAILNALKSPNSTFREEGLQKLENYFGFRIKTKESFEQESKIKTLPLTSELAQNNPGLFKESLMNILENKYPRIYRIWEKLCSDKRFASLENLKIDAQNWESSADHSNGITIGVAPMPTGLKYRIIFDDHRFNYEDEVIYRFIHEMSHKLIPYLGFINNNQSEFNHLLATLTQQRTQNPDQGLSSLASLGLYKNLGPLTQAREDITEMVNMYLQDPDYFKKYLAFMSNINYAQIRKEAHLLDIDDKMAQVIFETIERGLAPFLAEIEKTGKN